MFIYEERTKIDELLNLGLVDSFRYVSQKDVVYLWWSYQFNVKERNIEWRIGYIYIYI